MGEAQKSAGIARRPSRFLGFLHGYPLSELRKGTRANGNARRWFSGTDEDALYLSVLVTGEIRHKANRNSNCNDQTP